jgi:hypothetical protein
LGRREHPDGDALVYRWTVDDVDVVAEGPSLAVTFTDLGEHRVVVRVTDGEDVTLHEWTIVVEETPRESGLFLPYGEVILPAAIMGIVAAAVFVALMRRRTR